MRPIIARGPAPQDKAFAVFTERFGEIKPPEHNLLSAPIAETVLEGRVGGHIYDRAVDGTECRWARILVFEPPERTRVELEHRHIDRHGPGWDSLADGVGEEQGWPLYLSRCARLIG